MCVELVSVKIMRLLNTQDGKQIYSSRTLPGGDKFADSDAAHKCVSRVVNKHLKSEGWKLLCVQVKEVE